MVIGRRHLKGGDLKLKKSSHNILLSCKNSFKNPRLSFIFLFFAWSLEYSLESQTFTTVLVMLVIPSAIFGLVI